MLATEFEWFRCPDGYRITSAKDHLKTDWNGAPELVRFIKSSFTRGGFEDVYQDESLNVIAANSNKVSTYKVRPDTSLYLAFLHVRTADELLKFITQHGPLTPAAFGDRIDFVLKDAERFRATLKVNERSKRFSSTQNINGRAEAVELGQLVLRVDPKRGPVFIFKPRDLMHFISWQFARQLQGGVEVRSCRFCSELFEVGPSTGVRADATFCCKEHSTLFHSSARSRKPVATKRRRP